MPHPAKFFTAALAVSCSALLLCTGAYAQRIVCDETCKLADAARNKVQTMPGGGYATAEIELPGNWDSLMAELGYKPLKEFKL